MAVLVSPLTTALTVAKTLPSNSAGSSSGNFITNLILQSQTFDTTWSSGNNGIKAFTANAVAAPDGTTTADFMIEDNTNNVHQTFQNISPAASTVYTFSVYVKPNGRTWFELRYSVGFDGVGSSAFFNLSGVGSLGTKNGVMTQSTITQASNGFYRCSATARSQATPSGALMVLRLATADVTDSYAGDNASGAYLWGAQLESGFSANTYIPTTTAAVTAEV